MVRCDVTESSRSWSPSCRPTTTTEAGTDDELFGNGGAGSTAWPQEPRRSEASHEHPGYTADLSLRPAVGHYSGTFTSPVAHELVVPQRDAVVVYDSDYGTDVELGSGPVGAENKGPTVVTVSNVDWGIESYWGVLVLGGIAPWGKKVQLRTCLDGCDEAFKACQRVGETGCQQAKNTCVAGCNVRYG